MGQRFCLHKHPQNSNLYVSYSGPSRTIRYWHPKDNVWIECDNNGNPLTGGMTAKIVAGSPKFLETIPA